MQPEDLPLDGADRDPGLFGKPADQTGPVSRCDDHVVGLHHTAVGEADPAHPAGLELDPADLDAVSKLDPPRAAGLLERGREAARIDGVVA